MKRLFLCICIFLSLVPVDLWGQNRAGLQPSKLETEVLYDVEGIAYKQVWRKDGKVVRCCYLTRSGQKVENATWCVDTQWVSTLADKVLDIAELRLTDVLPKEYKEMLLRAVRDAESDIRGLEGETPILALFPVRFTTN